jgi:endoglucanase
MFMFKMLARLLGGWLLLAGSAQAGTAISAHEQVSQMGAGVNVLGYDPYWQDGATGNYQAHHFQQIREAGFATVRVVLFTFPHLDAQGRLAGQWLDKLDWVVDSATGHGLQVILDVHDFNACAQDMNACATRLEQVWSQLAPRYADRPASVMFELLNEPHGQLNAAAWNALFPRLLAVVRASNPQRNVVVGPVSWNSFRHLDSLQLPADDRHLIATFHYYEPFEFTHQGASWVEEQFSSIKDLPFGTPEQVAQIGRDFDQVKAWSLKHDRPILLGEFGAYDKAPMASRVKWTASVAEAARQRGFAYAYWQFSSDFILYDFQQQAWVEPLLNAILPPPTP